MFKKPLLLVLLSLWVSVWCVAFAATTQKDPTVTLHLKNVTVKTFLDAIQQQTNFNFVYNAASSRSFRLLSINAVNEPVSKVLDRVFDGTECSYRIEGSIISLRFQQKAPAVAVQKKWTLTLMVVDATEKKPLDMANCSLKALNTFALTDKDGKAELKGLPEGEVTVEVTYLGYEPSTQTVNLTRNTTLAVRVVQKSLKLKDLTVVARSGSAGTTTSSNIGREAIDHLQATSLADVMQLIPGALMSTPDLTAKSNLQIRTLVNNTTNAFGASVIVDGVPISSNADLGSKGVFSATEFSGVDLRQVSADNIESVEVIRGIPSAEYGDLTSGAVIVHTQSGHTPWQARAKVNPSTMNYSLGKGFKLGKESGVVNLNLDYVQAWGDPRKKTESFDRYTGNLTYTRDFMKIWRTTTKLSYSGLVDWNGNDPDQVNDGTFVSEKSARIAFSHNGKIAFNKRFSRVVKYAAGYSYGINDYRLSKIVTNSSGFLPILNATQTGYFQVPFETTSYKASGGNKSNPSNLFLKVSNSFYHKTKNTFHQFNMGLEYKNDRNTGIGYYNDDNRYPLQPNDNGRPRPYYDIPALNQLSGYVEDNIRIRIDKRYLRMQLGLRYAVQQPSKEEQSQSLSPRLNASWGAFDWLDVRAGLGISSKAPGLIHLYPDKMYTDRIAANYVPVGDAAGEMVLYQTQVYETQRTKGLKNANNLKYELGLDFKLPGDRKLSLIGYWDQTRNGFGAATEYYTYTSDYFTKGNGLIVSAGNPTIVDWNNPARRDTLFSTTGRIGNTNVSVNKGIEMDMELGHIQALQSSFYLTGAYMTTETYSTSMNSSNPQGLPSSYAQTNTTPFKIVYPSGVQKDRYKQASTNLRVVTHIPQLRMVASLSTQMLWYTSSYTTNQKVDPIAWIDTDLSVHEITSEMLNDPAYTIKGVLLSKQRRNPTDNPTSVEPIVSLISARLTKELGDNSTCSFYANNFLYHEPFLHNSVSTTLSQHNEGTFSFGAELTINF